MKKHLLKIQIAVSSLSLLLPAFAPDNAGARDTNLNRTVAGQKIGIIEEATKVIGSELKDAKSQTIGKIEDVVVDLESGRILYGIGSVNGAGDHIAIAPTLLPVHHSGKGHLLSFDNTKLSGAPKVDAGRENDLGNGAFVGQVFQFYGVPAWWDTSNQASSFNNVHKVSTLRGQPVKNVANADLAKVDDVILDLHAGRIPFVIITGTANALYAVPPNAFTLGEDKKTLVTGLDQNALKSAPRYTRGNLQMLANRGTATAIYKHFGKDAYFTGPEALSPTGR